MFGIAFNDASMMRPLMHQWCIHWSIHIENKYNNSNVRSRCGPGNAILFLFARCCYLSIFDILLFTD